MFLTIQPYQKSILHSDNGREFVDEIVHNLAGKNGLGEVTLVHSRQRNPKCQGMAEQGNEMVEKLLVFGCMELLMVQTYPP